MNKIILPEYENVLDNEIFIKFPKDIPGDAKVLRINKFRHPTLEELLDKIALEAKRLIYYAGEDEKTETNGLLELLKVFPKERLEKMQDKNSKEIKKLRCNYQKSFLQEGKNYLEFIGGIVPNIALIRMDEIIKEEGEKKDADVYEIMIDKFGDQKGDIFLRLDGELLPKKEEIDYLTQQFVRTSGAITFVEDFGSYEKAKKYLDFIYKNNFNEIIPYLNDYSDIQMRSRAFILLEDLAKEVLKEKIRKELFGVARIIFKKKTEEPKKPDNLEKDKFLLN